MVNLLMALEKIIHSCDRCRCVWDSMHRVDPQPEKDSSPEEWERWRESFDKNKPFQPFELRGNRFVNKTREEPFSVELCHSCTLKFFEFLGNSSRGMDIRS